jgi:hypothetical protein
MALIAVAAGADWWAVNHGWLEAQGTLLARMYYTESYAGALNAVAWFEFIALWVNWRNANGAQRTRLAWIGIAIGLAPLTDVAMGVIELSPLWSLINPYQYVIIDIVSLLAAVCLSWAVLRHRVFNFGLVVQRTLALSVVSTLLLSLLGLDKWLAERLLHAAGHASGLMDDLVIAAIVVMILALVQQRVVTAVNALIFRRWHEAAEALRAFVDRAAQVTDPALLQQRFVAAVDSFARGTGGALYLVNGEGHLIRTSASIAGAPDRIDVNDALTIELRHGARRVDLTRMQTQAQGEWAFAMSVRGHVSGALLLGPRHDGISYRPEELAQLEDSARRIGLDLESLRVSELQRTYDALVQKVALQAVINGA